MDLRKKQVQQWVLLFLVIVAAGTLQADSTAYNSSEFPGEDSRSRLAYYRWQEWFMSRLAVQKKIPPLPTVSSAGVKDRPDILVLLSPVTIFSVDAAHQTVQMSAQLLLQWQDPALAVDNTLVEEFTDGNSTLMPEFLIVSHKDLWLPNIIFTEGFDYLSIYENNVEIRILQNGSVLLQLTVILNFGCRFNMDAYPFDEHQCPISVVDINGLFDLFPWGQPWDENLGEKFGVRGEWDLVNVTEKTLISAGQVYPKFVLHLRRKTTFYSVVMLFPMVLTSYLNVLVFLLPPDLGDKASYLVTLTVSMSVYVAFFNSDMPRGLDSMPRILVLLIFVYVESFCIMLMCLVVLMKSCAEKQSQEAGTSGSVVKGSVDRMYPEQVCPSTVPKPSTLCMPARRLDTLFFVLAFVVNTVGLASILIPLSDAE